MNKELSEVDLRKSLHTKFRAVRGSIQAFCEVEGISTQWFRMTLTGMNQDVDLLIRAAEFLEKHIAQEQAISSTKMLQLAEAVSKIPQAATCAE